MDRKGIFYAIGAYMMWGFFPLYWKQLETISALQLIGHRIGWSFILLLIVILVTRQWQAFRAAAMQNKTIRIYLAAAILISVNWFTYVWAVTHGYVVETSLGYYINPLFSVLLGVTIFHERLRPVQWIPIVLAALGVLYLTITYRALPWIALALAFSFGLYGMVKKTAPLGSLYGLTLETGLLFIPALAYIFAANPTEIEVGHAERVAGESKYSLYRLIRLNFDLVTGFSIVPLQWFSLIGTLLSLGSAALFVLLLVRRFVLGAEVQGVFTLFALQFFLIGILLFGIGLMGEYVGRIQQEVRRRPRYRISAVLQAPGPASQHAPALTEEARQ